MLTIAFSLFMWVGSAWGLTVDNVIAMHKAGVPASVIASTVKSSGVTFKA